MSYFKDEYKMEDVGEEINNNKFEIAKAIYGIKKKNNDDNDNNNEQEEELIELTQIYENNELNWNNFLLMKWETTYNTKIILFQYNILFLVLLFILFFSNYIIGIIVNLIFIGTKFNSVLLQISFEIFISTLFVNLILMISILIITANKYFIFYKKKNPISS